MSNAFPSSTSGQQVPPVRIRILLLLPFVSLLLLPACGPSGSSETQTPPATNSSSYLNPIDVEFGDPYILANGDGTYYMYGTGGGAKDGFLAYSSTNLVDWTAEGQVYQGNTPSSWNEDYFWAPEVYQFDDRYYLFFSAQWKDNPTNEAENFMIGVAVSDSPTGPFEDLYDRPIFDPGYPIIDANVFQDTDGTFYLYYSRACYKHPVESELAEWARQEGMFEEIEESWIYGVELKPDFSGVVGTPRLLLRPPLQLADKQAEWESRSVTAGEINRRWTEGSFTFRYQGTYYMMYSANYYAGENYAIGYATADHPLGPYSKAPNNPILQKNTPQGGEVTGTGHNMVLFSTDSTQMYCVYHGRTKASGQDRVVFIDQMHISDAGVLRVDGPSTSERPMPFSR